MVTYKKRKRNTYNYGWCLVLKIQICDPCISDKEQRGVVHQNPTTDSKVNSSHKPIKAPRAVKICLLDSRGRCVLCWLFGILKPIHHFLPINIYSSDTNGAGGWWRKVRILLWSSMTEGNSLTVSGCLHEVCYRSREDNWFFFFEHLCLERLTDIRFSINLRYLESTGWMNYYEDMWRKWHGGGTQG